MPNEERDLAIAANNSWVLAFDNLSGLSNQLSDALCKVSTGGGLATRKLYSDDEEAVFQIMRPVILNGIDDIGHRQDLLDRSIVINLPSINQAKRKDESTFWKEFMDCKAAVLGFLCGVISHALAELPNIELINKPRMADFALWVTAAEKALGWPEGELTKIYTGNRAKAVDQGLESDPLAVTVQLFMEERTEWESTPQKTLEQLERYLKDEKIKKSKAWPTANKLKQRLRRIAPALRTKCIEFIELPRTSKGRLIRLEKVQKEPTQLTQLTQVDNVNSFDYDGRADVSDTIKSQLTWRETNNPNGYDSCDNYDGRKSFKSNTDSEDLVI
ncbi:hypothetical protein [Halalkalibacter flavus]|uniref:hypothetical protein n=1 Tax=Halalkalibacter flavus TaxID=3090668 RepID=UPI002FC7B947